MTGINFKLGQDSDSLLVDPLFVDPGNHDYRLQPDSPAIKMGFKPLPINKMGLVETDERASRQVIKLQLLYPR